MQPIVDSIEAVSERSWNHYSAMIGLEENSAMAGVYRGIHYFPLQKRFWELVRTASLRQFLQVPTIYVWSRNKNNNVNPS